MQVSLGDTQGSGGLSKPRPIGSAFLTWVTLTALALPLAACPGMPVTSISYRPDNIYDDALEKGSLGNEAEVAKDLLNKRFPPGTNTAILVSYLTGIGSDCASYGDSRHVCHMSSFRKSRIGYWFINATLWEGETFDKWEYRYTTIIDSSRGKIDSIDVTSFAVRLK